MQNFFLSFQQRRDKEKLNRENLKKMQNEKEKKEKEFTRDDEIFANF